MAKIASETFTKVSERTTQAEENIESADGPARRRRSGSHELTGAARPGI